jgi:hypothetical protein
VVPKVVRSFGRFEGWDEYTRKSTWEIIRENIKVSVDGSQFRRSDDRVDEEQGFEPI